MVAAFAIRFVYELYHTEQVSADLEMPMWLVYMGLPIGSSLMCFRFLQVCWKFVQTGQFPRPDHAKVEGLDQETDPLGGHRKRREPAHRKIMTAAIIFGLLIALMLTGMPISISLGLTVLAHSCSP